MIKSFLRSFNCLLLLSISLSLCAQNAGNGPDASKKEIPKKEYVTGTFKSTELINGHTPEITPRGTMDFKISHRFGLLNSGFYNFFGLDEAHARFGFDFGITDNLMVGLGHNTHIGTYDAFVKFRFLQQTTGEKPMPVSASFYAGAAVNARKKSDLEAIMFTPTQAYFVNDFSDRVSYVFQLLLARKFSEGFSFQVVPTLVHHDNIFLNDREEVSVYKKINAFVLGTGLSQKLSKKMYLTAEYYYEPTSTRIPGTTNSLSAGIDLVTSGHVFQLQVTNSRHMQEQSFLTHSTGKWRKGDVLFGFNLHRKFYLKKKPRRNIKPTG